MSLATVFVYGTLKRGQVRESCWPHLPERVERATTRGRLFDFGPYPAMTAGEETIGGELWHISPHHMPPTLRVLDEIECFGRDDVDLYVRRIIECCTEDGRTVSAYAYFLAQEELLAGLDPIRPNPAGTCEWP